MKFTDSNVAAVQPADRDLWLRDEEVPSFYLRVRPTGGKTYVVKYKRRGASQTVTIGRIEHWSAAKARGEAKQLLAAVDRREDPAADRAARRAALSLKAIATLWLGFDPMDEQEEPKKSAKRKASTQDGYARALRRHVIPAIGNLPLDDINTAAVGRIARALGDRPSQRNKTLRVLSSLFRWAARNGHCRKGHNPAASDEVERVTEDGRERFLTSEELARLGEVIRQAETVGLPVKRRTDKRAPKLEQGVIIDQSAAAAIRLLLLTGCRLREILNLEWTRIDFERGVINLSEAKRGRRPVILNAPALQILSELPRIGRFVIAGSRVGEKGEKPRYDIKRAWQRVRAAADLADVRGHDLRHTVGAFSASSGLGLQITGAILGHKSIQATQRYAHLANDPLKRAAERVGGEIAAHLGLGLDAKTDNVVELKRAGDHG